MDHHFFEERLDFEITWLIWNANNPTMSPPWPKNIHLYLKKTTVNSERVTHESYNIKLISWVALYTKRKTGFLLGHVYGSCALSYSTFPFTNLDTVDCWVEIWKSIVWNFSILICRIQWHEFCQKPWICQTFRNIQ